MKKSKIIVPALGLLLLSTAASVSGTVAWFTANSVTSITGMSFTTKVSSNLLIADDVIGSTAKLADEDFTDSLEQTKTAILEPVSTTDGRQFFYTTNAKADGDATSDTYTAYTTQAAFATAYGQTGVATVLPYLDYVFQLKAVNVSNGTLDLKVTNLTLTYGGTADGSKAYRVAFFVEDITSSNPTGTLGVSAGTADGIYAPSGAVNHSDADSKNFAVSGASAAPTQLSVTGNKYNNLTKLATVAKSTVSVPASYYKVIARMYIEGEDTTCTNTTFAALNESWSLDMQISLGGEDANITSLGTAVTPAP